MIIIKEVPGLTARETYEALAAMVGDRRGIATGHGGFVVDEDTAEKFLVAYLEATGRRPKAVSPAAKRTTTRRSGGRKRGGAQ